MCLYCSRPVTFYTLDRLSANVMGQPGPLAQRDWSITLANPNVIILPRGWWAGPIRYMNYNVVVGQNARDFT